MNTLAKKILIISAALITACSQGPAPLHYGSDECSYCKMMISDNRFAAQIVTETGRSIKFDAIECMANYAGDNKPELESAKFWVSDFKKPGQWIEVRDAKIVRSAVVNSPMGASLLAISSGLEPHLQEYPGEVVLWQEIVK